MARITVDGAAAQSTLPAFARLAASSEGGAGAVRSLDVAAVRVGPPGAIRVGGHFAVAALGSEIEVFGAEMSGRLRQIGADAGRLERAVVAALGDYAAAERAAAGRGR